MSDPTDAKKALAKAVMFNLRKAPGYRGRLHSELEKMDEGALRALQQATQFLDAEHSRLKVILRNQPLTPVAH